MNTQYLSRPGGKIAYDASGSGPLVVCAAGMGDVRGQYRFLAPLLVAAGYRVVTMDLRGHGESSVGWSDYSAAALGSDIVALLGELNAGPATLIGNSFTGASSVWAAAEAPELVSKLVLVDPFVREIPASLMQRIMLAVLLTGPWKVAAWLMYYSSLYPTHKPADFADYKAKLGANLRQPGRFAALKAMMATSSANCEARTPEVKAPTLVVMGTKDPDFKDPAAEAKLVAGMLHGEVYMVEGAGHYPPAEMPEQIAPRIIAFLGATSNVR